MLEEQRARTVLVVDDESMIVRLVHRLLDDAWTVTDANDGPSAIAAWRAASPDVVVLDYMMAGTSGLDVAEQILAEDPSQRIVLFTAATSLTLADQAAAVGIRRCITKTDVMQLPDVLAEVLAED